MRYLASKDLGDFGRPKKKDWWHFKMAGGTAPQIGDPEKVRVP